VIARALDLDWPAADDLHQLVVENLPATFPLGRPSRSLVSAPMGHEERSGRPWRSWKVCDARLGWAAGIPDIKPHRHRPDVQHRVDGKYLTAEECVALSQRTECPEPAGTPTGPVVGLKERTPSEALERLIEITESAAVGSIVPRLPPLDRQSPLGAFQKQMLRAFTGRR
jgi:hypothetical protein